MIEKLHDEQPERIRSPGEIVNAPGGLRAKLETKYRSRIPAGYTYFGQFVDHDITFDPTPLRMRRNDPNGIHNFRTPRLDLDSVYGRGPDDEPYLYNRTKAQKGKMLIGRIEASRLRDLPRNEQGCALIGDARNDENAIVSQLHLAFLLAHNTLVDRARVKAVKDPFETARRTLCWLYQYILWNDFIKQVTSTEMHKRALKLVKARDNSVQWELGLTDVYSWKEQPFMPVEFSAAAYRFGHSMVRNDYQTNDPIRKRGKFAPLFDGGGAKPDDDLQGRRKMRAENVVQWDWFLKMKSSQAAAGFPQMARKIDTKLANALAFLPQERSPMNLLAYRNLQRGVALGLPAGSAMARKFGLKPLKLEDREPDALWYYILREADSPMSDSPGNKLGPLGSLIVCATFAGLLKGDPSSYFNVEPRWTPAQDDLLLRGKDNVDGTPVGGSPGTRAWTLASIIRIAGLPVNAREFRAQA
jgi:hypothetical protein